MVNKMEIRRERLRDGAKLRVALAAQVVKRKIARLQRRAQIGLPRRGKICPCSIAASVAPLFRLRKATNLTLTLRGIQRSEDRLLIPVGKDLLKRLAAKTFRPGAVIAAPRLPRLYILQARMAAFNDQPAQCLRRGWLAKFIATRPPSE